MNLGNEEANKQARGSTPVQYKGIAYPTNGDDGIDDAMDGHGQQHHGKPALSGCQHQAALRFSGGGFRFGALRVWHVRFVPGLVPPQLRRGMRLSYTRPHYMLL